MFRKLKRCSKLSYKKYILLAGFILLNNQNIAQGENNVQFEKEENIVSAVPSTHALLKNAEDRFDLPNKLLFAVAYVESKWHPWAVNAGNKSFYFRSKTEAIDFVKKMKKKKVANIGVGYMQINLSVHEDKFKSLEEAFDPEKNINYGAKLISYHYKRFSEWEKAIKYYHTANPRYNVAYKSRVYRVWDEMKSKNTMNPKHGFLKMGFGPGMGIVK